MNFKTLFAFCLLLVLSVSVMGTEKTHNSRHSFKGKFGGNKEKEAGGVEKLDMKKGGVVNRLI